MNKSTAAFIKQIEDEYENIHTIFDSIKNTVFQRENLITHMARHPLFEVEPFEEKQHSTKACRGCVFSTNHGNGGVSSTIPL